MKTIKIKFIGFWNGFNDTDNLFYNTLKEKYNIELSDEPDFLIVSCLSAPFEYAKYDCVRILFVGENISPDFTAFDYVIGCDDIVFSDRYIKYPLSLYCNEGEFTFPERPTEEEAYQILKQKKYFCNFIYGHQSYSDKREQLFKALDKYKRVDSFGTFLNNQPDGKFVSGTAKYDVVKESKFTIAGESVVYPGFNTEKIKHPLQHNSIPIYAGDPLIKTVFNPKSFIYMEDFDSINDLVDHVISIDTDDRKYVEMLMEPAVSEGYCAAVYEKLKGFLFNIFDQAPKDAQRRMKCFASQRHNDYMKEYNKFQGSVEYKILKKFKRY